MPDKPPLIASQRILLLDPGIRNPREFLRPEAFRAARLRPSTADRPDATDANASYWRAVGFRELFLDGSIERLGLATEAGFGKTTALRRAQHEIMQADGRVLAIYARLGICRKRRQTTCGRPGRRTVLPMQRLAT